MVSLSRFDTHAQEISTPGLERSVKSSQPRGIWEQNVLRQTWSAVGRKVLVAAWTGALLASACGPSAAAPARSGPQSASTRQAYAQMVDAQHRQGDGGQNPSGTDNQSGGPQPGADSTPRAPKPAGRTEPAGPRAARPTDSASRRQLRRRDP